MLALAGDIKVPECELCGVQRCGGYGVGGCAAWEIGPAAGLVGRLEAERLGALGEVMG